MLTRSLPYQLAGAYYLEWDQLGQLLIAGPDNHLYFGGIGLDQDNTEVVCVANEGNELVVELSLTGPKFSWHDPAIAHIRKYRALTELRDGVRPTLAIVAQTHPGVLAPNFIDHEANVITYRRNYDDNYYGVTLTLPKGVTAKRDEVASTWQLYGKGLKQFKVTLRTVTHYAKLQPDDYYRGAIFLPKTTGQDVLTEAAITHLITHDKTSGLDYGTIFPRDWMEAADLGANDLSRQAIAYMYHKAIEYIDASGRGWHENIVGEYAAERRDEIRQLAETLDELLPDSGPVKFGAQRYLQAMEDTFIVRNMIDIEPHYLLGLLTLPPEEWSKADLTLLRRVAPFIMRQAEANELITFQKRPPSLEQPHHVAYYSAGDWRDSGMAYQMVSPIIAPYDVNVVFYPQALMVMRQHAEVLGLEADRVERLQDKWSRVKAKYRFTNQDGRTAYALALYDVHHDEVGVATYKMLRINHLDEAYDLFYGQPEEADLVSFAQRLLDPAYFYTPSGPMVVGRDQGYNTTYYHGEVIWTKQTAFVVEGLVRQLERRDVTWENRTRRLMEDALRRTAEANLGAVAKLGLAPELHYDRDGEPHFYNDQPQAEGPMSLLQLWSVVGLRCLQRRVGYTAKD